MSVIALSIIYLYNSALLQISSVDGFGIIVRHVSPLGSLCDREAILMNQAHESCPLLICYLRVLSDHIKCDFVD